VINAALFQARLAVVIMPLLIPAMVLAPSVSGRVIKGYLFDVLFYESVCF
jgi:hypothetical protein